jgi:hypothetical protein
MKRITIWLMNYHLNRAKNYRNKLDNDIIIKAYDVLIKNYKDTIMFLKAEIKKTTN